MPLNTINSGGAVSIWSITPSLPSGLSFNPSTGVITGTAAAVSANTTYTITATNATGSDDCSFDISVSPPNPLSLSGVACDIVDSQSNAVVRLVTCSSVTLTGATAPVTVSSPQLASAGISISAGVVDGHWVMSIPPLSSASPIVYDVTFTDGAGNMITQFSNSLEYVV